MNKRLRKLNEVTASIIYELELDISVRGNPDICAYLELNKLMMRVDNIISLMLFDTDDKQRLN
jgi:hypothetical protein